MNQTLTLNGDFFRDLSVVAEDEGLLKRVVKYVKKLAKEKQADPEMNAWLNSL